MNHQAQEEAHMTKKAAPSLVAGEMQILLLHTLIIFESSAGEDVEQPDFLDTTDSNGSWPEKSEPFANISSK